jgi:glutathionylspermidine synthase
LRDTAEQAGLKTQALKMSDIGFDHNTFTFVDLEGKPIKSIFKLYPWEWMLKEEFGSRALDFMDKTQWMEPIWKMMFSNKGLLAILWEMYPGHELLLPAYLDGPREMKDYVRKPLLGREGANVQVIRQGEKEQSYGRYGEEGWVYQALAPIPCMDGHYPVLGSWMIADLGAAGMGIRESDTIITTNRSRFVPHLFR